MSVTVIKNMTGINITIVIVIKNMTGINIMIVTVTKNMTGINIMIVTVLKNMTVNLTGWTNMLIVIAAKSMTHAGSQKHCSHVIKNITIVKKNVIVIVNV